MALSVHYQAFQAKFDRLAEAIKPVVSKVAVKAFARGLISDHNKSDAEISSINEYNRASQLLGRIHDKIKERETHFGTFVSILNDIPVLNGMANELSHDVETASLSVRSLKEAVSISRDHPSRKRYFSENDTPQQSEILVGNIHADSLSSLPILAGGRQFRKKQLSYAAVKDPSIWLANFSPEDGKLHLNEEAIALLKTSNKPVAVLSICGPYRTGKSSFLSHMLRTNDHDYDTFKVSSEIDPCTEGIWMSTTVLECDDFVVVLLDTEGTDAAQEREFSATDVTKLLVLTTLSSSYLIYNTTGPPKQRVLSEMSCFFSHVTESILLHEGSCASDHLQDKNLQLFFPQFLWLLRDNTDVNKNITEHVKVKIVSPEKIIPQTRTRPISVLFPKLECMLVPPPGEPPDEFLAAINEVRNFILTNIHPNRSFEHRIPITGPILANLMEQYVSALNAPSEMPNLALSWLQAVKPHLVKQCQKLVVEYYQEMSLRLRPRLAIEEGELKNLQIKQSPNTLAGIHQEVFATKLNEIHEEAAHMLPSNKQTTEELIAVHFQTKVIEGEFSKIVDRNHRLSQQHCEELFDNLYKEQTSNIQLQKLKADYFKEAVGPAKENVYRERVKDIPGPPLNVEIELKSVYEANLKVRWNQPDINAAAAEQYEVEVLNDQSSNWMKYKTSGPVNQIKIDVEPNSEYELRIRGVNERKNGQYCERAKFKTLPDPHKSDKHQKPSITTGNCMTTDTNASATTNDTTYDQLQIESDGGLSQSADVIQVASIDLKHSLEISHSISEPTSDSIISFSNELGLCVDSGCPNQPTMEPVVEVTSPTEVILHVQRPEEEGNRSPIDTIVVETSINDDNGWRPSNYKISPGEHYLQLTKRLPKTGISLISFRVRWQNEKGVSEPSSISKISLDDLIPGKPSEVEHVSTSHSITLLWSPPHLHPNAVQGYLVQCKQGTEWDPAFPNMCNSSELTYSFTQLCPNTKCEYRICALNKSGKHAGYYSGIAMTDKCPPNKPKNVRMKVNYIVPFNVAEITAHNPDVHESGSPITRICLYSYNKDDQRCKTSYHYIGTIDNDNQVVLTSKPIENEVHFFRFCFINEKGMGELSEPLQIRTSELTPGKVSSLFCMKADFDRFTLSWSKPDYMGRAATSYEVMVKNDGTWIVSDSQSSTKLEIPGLKPCTKYDVHVRAVNGVLKGEFSEIKASTVAARPLKPRIECLYKHGSDPTKAVIRFHRLTKEEERGSPVDTVALELWLHDCKEWDPEPLTVWPLSEAESDENATIIEEEFDISEECSIAEEETLYRIRMYSGHTQSEPSDSHTIQPTTKLQPGRVENLRVLDTKLYSIKIGWDAPTVNPRVIKQYVINCYDKDSDLTSPQTHEVDQDCTSFEIESLSSGQRYMFEVYATTEICISGPQAFVEATTIFHAPQNIHSESRQSTAVKIRWEKPDQPVKPAYYIVSIRSIGFTKQTRGMSTVIRNLEPSEKYTVEVTSVNEDDNRYDEDSKISTASATIETSFGVVKQGAALLALTSSALKFNKGVRFAENIKRADDKDMEETDEEYEP